MSDEVKKITVSLEAHLFEGEIPLVSLFKRKSGQGEQKFIACAIPNEDDVLGFYFAVSVGRHYFIKYMLGQCDLRYLFAFAAGRKFYVSESIASNKFGKVVFKEFKGQLTEDLLPDGQFFASFHTTEYGILGAVNGEQRLLIDGNWEMDEFGEFYTKFSDLYSFEQAISYVQIANERKAEEVRKAFAAKPFKGGSSYKGFFNDLLNIIPAQERPALEGIEYHSPGHVDLKGRDEILAALKENVVSFLDRYEDIQVKHDNLRAFMSKSKLLSIRGAIVDAPVDVLKMLASLTADLFDVLPVSGKDKLRELTKENEIVRAKIGLALYRRLRTTALYFAQGRLQYN